ncbi:hypothetical protein FIU97_04515 [Roseivivax sp. THAF40]|uniref:DUF3168 domain-containing protein n=1 Tax=unclassified Roseivivax TaxID=2639302 RepID=UPI001267AFFB|nr:MULTISPECIES: DUF3168 domain-containing protein [unclassified Roseivivax]QFS82033.1 hypothetical protein FIV09_04255 [Roseivivax sp. THAF197b]QFT45833.1 hypothetical protein FIU97_04515 [Roseivivax sp. THAF40]
MSYALSDALQEAVYTALVGDPGLALEVGGHVYDALPTGPLPELYVSLGPEKVRDASDMGVHGAWHDLSVIVATDAAGFRSAKRAAAAICDALDDAALPLARGRLVSLRFLKADAKRRSGDTRRIEMIFRARVDDE